MMKLFLDLDSVLADFGGVLEVTGKRPENLSLKTMWAALARAPRFSRRYASWQARRYCGSSARRTIRPS
jgi:hypothetical protein